MALGSFLDKAKKAAQKSLDKVSESLDSIDTDEIFNNLKETKDSVSHSLSEALGNSKESSKNFVIQTAEKIEQQIRKVVQNLNLEEMIDGVNKVGTEKDVNVKPLVDFLERLKEFGDGE